MHGWINTNDYLASSSLRHDPLVRLRYIVELEDGINDRFNFTCKD